ncbi:MAG: hypothetical protein SGARI_004103, partial [Bacillariaceae sp.]
MKFSPIALKLAIAAMLPHASMAGLRGGRQMEAETPALSSQAPTGDAADDALAPSQAPDDDDSSFDIPAMLEDIFDEFSENHEQPEYQYTEEFEDLVVLPSKESLAEEWTLYVHDGTNRMNRTVFFDEFVADVYPDTIFSEESMDNIWDAFSQGQQFVDRDILVAGDNIENTLCPDDVEPLSICLPVQMRMMEFPEPISDEEALQSYADLISDEVYHRLLSSKPTREQAI